MNPATPGQQLNKDIAELKAKQNRQWLAILNFFETDDLSVATHADSNQKWQNWIKGKAHQYAWIVKLMGTAAKPSQHPWLKKIAKLVVMSLLGYLLQQVVSTIVYKIFTNSKK